MKICCVLAYSRSRNRVFYEKDSISQSTLCEIESALAARGHDVIILDYLSEEISNPENINMVLKKFSPDIVCIYALHQIEDCSWFFDHVEISLFNCIFVAVGSGVIDVKRTFSIVPELSYIIPCCSEGLLPRLVECVSSQTKSIIPEGIAYKEGSEIVFADCPEISSNETFPGVDAGKLVSRRDHRSGYMRTSKGCWYGRCTYCTVAACYKGANKWIVRDMENVIDEAKALYERGVRQYTFLDDEFIGPGKAGKERALLFANEFLRSCPSARFSIRTRIDTVDADIIFALKEAGLSALFIGIESLSHSFLESTKKGYVPQLIFEKWEILKKAGVTIVPGIIIAHSNSTLNDLLEHFTGIESLYSACQYTMPLSPVFHKMHLHAGTQAYDEAVGSMNYNVELSEIECPYSDQKVEKCIDSIAWLGQQILPILSELKRAGSSRKILYSYLVKKKTFVLIKKLINHYIRFGLNADGEWKKEVAVSIVELRDMIFDHK